jgi:hypothetical protein
MVDRSEYVQVLLEEYGRVEYQRGYHQAIADLKAAAAALVDRAPAWGARLPQLVALALERPQGGHVIGARRRRGTAGRYAGRTFIDR